MGAQCAAFCFVLLLAISVVQAWNGHSGLADEFLEVAAHTSGIANKSNRDTKEEAARDLAADKETPLDSKKIQIAWDRIFKGADSKEEIDRLTRWKDANFPGNTLEDLFNNVGKNVRLFEREVVSKYDVSGDSAMLLYKSMNFLYEQAWIDHHAGDPDCVHALLHNHGSAVANAVKVDLDSPTGFEDSFRQSMATFVASGGERTAMLSAEIGSLPKPSLPVTDEDVAALVKAVTAATAGTTQPKSHVRVFFCHKNALMNVASHGRHESGEAVELFFDGRVISPVHKVTRIKFDPVLNIMPRSTPDGVKVRPVGFLNRFPDLPQHLAPLTATDGDVGRTLFGAVGQVLQERLTGEEVRDRVMVGDLGGECQYLKESRISTVASVAEEDCEKAIAHYRTLLDEHEVPDTAVFDMISLAFNRPVEVVTYNPVFWPNEVAKQVFQGGQSGLEESHTVSILAIEPLGSEFYPLHRNDNYSGKKPGCAGANVGAKEQYARSILVSMYGSEAANELDTTDILSSADPCSLSALETKLVELGREAGKKLLKHYTAVKDAAKEEWVDTTGCKCCKELEMLASAAPANRAYPGYVGAFAASMAGNDDVNEEATNAIMLKVAEYGAAVDSDSHGFVRAGLCAWLYKNGQADIDYSDGCKGLTKDKVSSLMDENAFLHAHALSMQYSRNIELYSCTETEPSVGSGLSLKEFRTSTRVSPALPKVMIMKKAEADFRRVASLERNRNEVNDQAPLWSVGGRCAFRQGIVSNKHDQEYKWFVQDEADGPPTEFALDDVGDRFRSCLHQELILGAVMFGNAEMLGFLEKPEMKDPKNNEEFLGELSWIGHPFMKIWKHKFSDVIAVMWDGRGRTPLFFVSSAGNNEAATKTIFEILIRNGADVCAKDAESFTALEHYRRHGDVQTADILAEVAGERLQRCPPSPAAQKSK